MELAQHVCALERSPCMILITERLGLFRRGQLRLERICQLGTHRPRESHSGVLSRFEWDWKQRQGALFAIAEIVPGGDTGPETALGASTHFRCVESGADSERRNDTSCFLSSAERCSGLISVSPTLEAGARS